SVDPVVLKQVTTIFENLKEMLQLRFISSGIQLFSPSELNDLEALKAPGEIYVENITSILQRAKGPWTDKFPLLFFPKNITFLAGKRAAFSAFVKQLVSMLDSRSSGLLSTKKHELVGLEMIRSSVST